MPNNVDIVILAAGKSSRFKSDKRAITLPHVLSVMPILQIKHKVSNIYLVMRDENIESDKVYLQNPNTIPVYLKADKEEGIGLSIAKAMEVVRADCVLICLADMPFIQFASYEKIIANSASNTITVPRYQGQQGNPVAFGREYYTELLSLRGDKGGKSIINKHIHAVCYVDLDDEGVVLDVDIPEDLHRIHSIK